MSHSTPAIGGVGAVTVGMRHAAWGDGAGAKGTEHGAHVLSHQVTGTVVQTHARLSPGSSHVQSVRRWMCQRMNV